jgi:hypothetical protein
MKLFAYYLLSMMALSCSVRAQDANPVQWHFSIEKKESGLYSLKAEATIKDQFHIWALDAGGDGSLIPTSFQVADSAAFVWKGPWQETPKPHTQTLEFVDGAVHWHEKTVTFYRLFQAPVNTAVSLQVSFQSCNEASCFPPETQTFMLRVKE